MTTKSIALKLGVVALLLTHETFLAHQTPQTTSPTPITQTALVAGKVINGVTGQVETQAVVNLTRGSDALALVQVDPKGRFVFERALPGEYWISAAKPGFQRGHVGQLSRDSMPRPVLVLPNQTVTDLIVRIWPYGSVSGRVLDETGEPVVGAMVEAHRQVYVSGNAFYQTQGPTTTDDRGVYWINSLHPGTYVVRVVSRYSMSAALDQSSSASQRAASAGGRQNAAAIRTGDYLLTTSFRPDPPVARSGERPLVYSSVFYPSNDNVQDANTVTVIAGEHMPGLDIRLKLSPGFTVSGRVSGPAATVSGLALRVLADSDDFRYPLNLETAQGATLTDGSFLIAGIPPGRYVLIGSRPGGPKEAPLLLHHRFLLSTQDISGVTAELRPAIKMAGRVQAAAGTLTALKLEGLRVVAETANGRFIGSQSRSTAAQVDASGRFLLQDLWPGQYVFRIGGAPDGFSLGGATLGSQEVSTTALAVEEDTRTELVITLTDSLRVLSGFVVDRAGKADSEATVVLFPADQKLWRNYGETSLHIHRIETERSGRFSLKGIRPGSYFVLAIRSDRLKFNWTSPDSLLNYSRLGERIQVGQVDLSLTLRSQPVAPNETEK